MTDESRPWQPQPDPDKPAKKGGVIANKIAQEILGEKELITDKTGAVFHYVGTHWVEATDAQMKSWAWDRGGQFKSSRSDVRGEVLSAIRAATFDPNHKWGRVQEWEVPCLSGVIDVRSRALRLHDPVDRLDRVIPWNYDAKAQCPVWRKVLEDWFGEGSEIIEGLQEFFGYMLLNHCRYKRACIVVGRSNSGKSLVVEAAMMLVGAEACCRLAPEDMEDPRRVGVIFGKALNIMTELSSDTLIRQGGFNAIVSGEPLLIDNKFKEPFMYSPTAKHLIAAEELPRVTDRAEGAFSRLFIVPMKRVFADDEQDTGLVERLKAEMPGILAWAIEGAARLVAHNGAWVEPRESAAMLAEYKREQNPVVAFLEECCAKADGVATPLTHLLKQFNAWHRGSKRIDVRGFAGLLRRHLGADALRKVKRKEFGGQSMRCLLSWKFVEFPRRVELTINPADAETRSDTLGEIEATGEEIMEGADDVR